MTRLFVEQPLASPGSAKDPSSLQGIVSEKQEKPDNKTIFSVCGKKVNFLGQHLRHALNVIENQKSNTVLKPAHKKNPKNGW